MPKLRIVGLVGVLCLWVVCSAAGAEAPPASRPASGPGQIAPLSDRLSLTEHQMKIDGQTLRYRARAGYMPVKDEAGKEKANFFFIAYEKLDADAAKRPITFIFNGGPGAAAVWLHLGTAGPMRIKMADEAGEAPAPPYQLVENAYTWLDLTDMVFIDPVGTGYSRPAQGEKAEQFYGVREDVASVADFIRLYTTRYERWPSPKFLAGESYGTTRAAALSTVLADRYGIALNGIVLISIVLDFQTLSPGGLNDLPYVIYLPSYAAVAWYHKKLEPDLPRDLNRLLEEVRGFAVNQYMPALARGANLPAEERRAIVTRLARYTALPAEIIEKSNLRPDPGVFRKQLLEDQRVVIGRFDARIKGFQANPMNPHAEFDPSLSGYLPAYSATINDYIRGTLRYENDLPYEVLSSRVGPWNFGQGSGYLNVADDLQNAMIRNPHLKVLFASGYFDLATPFFAADYTVNHLNLSPELRKNITRTYYTAGHMLYHELASLKKLKADLRGFIEDAAPTEGTSDAPRP